MLYSFALLAVAMVPARADGLALGGVHLTHGILGPARTDKRLLPGDSLYLAFTIKGLTADAAGKVRYSTLVEITDAAGKSIFRQPGKPQEVLNTLGGHEVPGHAQVDIGLNQAPGAFAFTLTVTDLATGKSQALTHTGVIQPKAFGLVRVATSADAEGTVPSGLLGPGQSLFVNAQVIGFERDAAKQPKLAFELRVLDAEGKPTLAAPLTGAVEKNVAATALSVPIQFLVSLNRPGKFTVELKATDKISGKTDTRSFPITVHQP